MIKIDISWVVCLGFGMFIHSTRYKDSYSLARLFSNINYSYFDTNLNIDSINIHTSEGSLTIGVLVLIVLGIKQITYWAF